MAILTGVLLFSVLVMLSFTAVFYKLSPYNGTRISYRPPTWEKAVLYFIIAYPVASLLVLLVPDGIGPLLENSGPQFESTFFIFSATHVFLSAMSAVVSYRLRDRNFWFRLFFALCIVVGTVYIAGLLVVFVD